jgi:Fe-coproporphyrin III synthase
MSSSRGKDLELVLKQLSRWVDTGVDRLRGRENDTPIRELHMELTHRCDLKCVMCHHWEMPARDPGSVDRELTLDEIRRVVTGSERLKSVRFVAVTGGEPLVRPEAVEIVAFLRGHFREASVGVLTNFWNTGLLRRRLGELRERGAGDLWLGTSLDGLGTTHDAVRGQPGAFSSFERSLAMVREEFPGLPISVNFTVLPENCGEIHAAHRWCAERGLGFGCQLVVEHEGFPAPKSFLWTEDALRVVEEQVDLVLADICRDQRALERMLTRPGRESQGLWNRMLFWWYLRKHGRGGPAFFDDCMAGRRYAMFDPEGRLFFCPVNKHKSVGGVRDMPFDELWDSPRARALRAGTIPCQCRCWLNCIANPVLDRVMEAAFDDAPSSA